MASRISTNLLSVSSIISFRERILSWFDSNGRSYPWRETSDPFRLLIAELMLRRTKADQVKSVYERLLSEYPDIDSLAEADCKRVEEILYPLGLKWRVAAFVRIAREICEKYNCKLPETRQALLTLPGVGEYVAGAVLSIAYGKNEWIVDSNIVRVFRRFFGIETSKEGRRDKHVIEMAKMYVSGSDARKANLAIIDFAALVCAARKPKHEQCPVNTDCHFFLRERHRSTGHSS